MALLLPSRRWFSASQRWNYSCSRCSAGPLSFLFFPVYKRCKRQPSGYWNHSGPSFMQNYISLIIAVSFNVDSCKLLSYFLRENIFIRCNELFWMNFFSKNMNFYPKHSIFQKIFLVKTAKKTISQIPWQKSRTKTRKEYKQPLSFIGNFLRTVEKSSISKPEVK